ncbi:MAG: hypothetical protein HC838_18095, partial [Spirulinaceae cyanobacterium RM2_2_10]|nr:hypothetical protein [Spirulinaceae cyanobacterium RM2_2_10]
KSELQILDDLETAAIGDIIRVGTEDSLDANEHTIALPEGIRLLTKARQMALAGASSAVAQRPVHPRRPPSNATQFVRDLRLGQTERGSYLIKLIAPVSDDSSISFDKPIPFVQGTPFSRRAVLELMRGLDALKTATEENKRQGRFVFNSYVSAVPEGVSANLCEALIFPDERKDTANPLEISVTWSFAIQSTENLSSKAVFLMYRIFRTFVKLLKNFERETQNSYYSRMGKHLGT